MISPGVAQCVASSSSALRSASAMSGRHHVRSRNSADSRISPHATISGTKRGPAVP